jgi:hypothetical protein
LKSLITAAVITASTLTVATPAYAHHDTATDPVVKYSEVARHLTDNTLAAKTAMQVPTAAMRSRDDTDRYLASNRASRGGGRWGDSGHPRWDRVPAWTRAFAKCVRAHESASAGLYRAENSISSASGAYQFLTGTWQGIAHWTRWRGEYVARRYPTAGSAPAWVQDLVFIHSVVRGGQHHWAGTGCGYGT